tara:strand:+ start:939 stop:1370 length:432 start_codon:yes stop_codon:yes gene_type:complete
LQRKEEGRIIVTTPAITYHSEVITLKTQSERFKSGAAVPKESFDYYAKQNELKFIDLVDIVNPLQHIPVVNHFYREATGDEIKPATKILGGGLFGGVIGMASATANATIEAQTGKDFTSHMLDGDYSSSDQEGHVHNNANRYN